MEQSQRPGSVRPALIKRSSVPRPNSGARQQTADHVCEIVRPTHEHTCSREGLKDGREAHLLPWSALRGIALAVSVGSCSPSQDTPQQVVSTSWRLLQSRNATVAEYCEPSRKSGVATAFASARLPAIGSANCCSSAGQTPGRTHRPASRVIGEGRPSASAPRPLSAVLLRRLPACQVRLGPDAVLAVLLQAFLGPRSKCILHVGLARLLVCRCICAQSGTRTREYPVACASRAVTSRTRRV